MSPSSDGRGTAGNFCTKNTHLFPRLRQKTASFTVRVCVEKRIFWTAQSRCNASLTVRVCVHVTILLPSSLFFFRQFLPQNKVSFCLPFCVHVTVFAVQKMHPLDCAVASFAHVTVLAVARLFDCELRCDFCVEKRAFVTVFASQKMARFLVRAHPHRCSLSLSLSFFL